MSENSNNNLVMHNQVTEVDADKINKNNWNPNFVPKKIMESIVDDIRQNGFIGSIIVQRHNKKMNKDYVIINGEHRFTALTKTFNRKTIPCTVLDCSDTTAKILSIRLNREHGELAPDRLAALLQDLGSENEFDELRRITAIEDAELKLYMNLEIDSVFVDEEDDDARLKTLEDIENEATKPQKQKKQSPNDQSVDQTVELDHKIYYHLDWQEFFACILKVADQVRNSGFGYQYIYSIPTGGTVGAFILGKMLKLEVKDSINPNDHVLVFDEIYDTGKTYRNYLKTYNRDLGADCKYAFAVMRDSSERIENPPEMKDIIAVGKMIDTSKYIVFPYDVYGLNDEPLLNRGGFK